jgi:predicted flap endonuclease-1-like 5' DNA nuclease
MVPVAAEEMQAVTDSEWIDAIAALKRVRARLESALHADADGQAPGGNDAPGDQREAKMAKSPMYKPWLLVGEAIDALRAVEAGNGGAVAAPDDLTSIQGIDAALARHLASLGITRFADIAAWRSDDVRNVSQALGFSREISRQNWIEQAALLERSKATSENVAAAIVREPVSELRSDLREVVEAARQETPAGEDAPSPLALELASQILGEQADAKVEAASSAREERVAPLPSASGAALRVDRHHTADADKSAWPPTPSPHEAQISTGAVPAAADAAERTRRLADARQRLAQVAERADSERLHDVDEAAVTFVIREPERARQPPPGASTPRAKPDLRNRLPSAGRSEPDAAAYVASRGVGEEAEVVFVKPQTRHGGAKRPEGGPVRRFLKALTGG